jgi:hypothetical protein
MMRYSRPHDEIQNQAAPSQRHLKAQTPPHRLPACSKIRTGSHSRLAQSPAECCSRPGLPLPV